MALQETLQAAGFVMPDINFSNAGDIGLYILVGALVAILLGAGVYLLVLHLKYNLKIDLFKKINNRIAPVAQYKGIFQRVGQAGDYWLRIRGMQKVLPRPTMAILKNVYWYYEREDGEWINICLEDIDEKMRQVGARYVHEDMRLQRLGIQKNLEKRYEKLSFWAKHGGMIMSIVYMLIITICLVIVFNKINDLVKALPVLADALRQVALAMRDVAQSQCSNGVLVPAGG